jgi:hypothetical protein
MFCFKPVPHLKIFPSPSLHACRVRYENQNTIYPTQTHFNFWATRLKSPTMSNSVRSQTACANKCHDLSSNEGVSLQLAWAVQIAWKLCFTISWKMASKYLFSISHNDKRASSSTISFKEQTEKAQNVNTTYSELLSHLHFHSSHTINTKTNMMLTTVIRVLSPTDAQVRFRPMPHTYTNKNQIIIHAATLPNEPRQCILTHFNNCNFGKAQIVCSLRMVLFTLKHVGAF